MKPLAVLSLATVAAACSAVILEARFDSATEGDFGTTYVDGGIRFFGMLRDPLEGPHHFVIEAATDGTLGASQSLPNVMGIGGYVPGSGMGFGRLKSFEFRADAAFSEMRFAELDFWTFNLNDAGNVVRLEGYFEGTLQDQVSFAPASWSVAHAKLVLPEDSYDRFVIRSEGPIDHGVVFAVFDNVRVSAIPVPEPTLGLAAGLIGLYFAKAGRRKSRA